MKSKRGSNKIYYYIDLFFIFLPILLLLFIGIYNLILFKSSEVFNDWFTNQGYTILDLFFVPFYYDGDAGFIGLNLDNIVTLIGNLHSDVISNNSFAFFLRSLISNIIHWFGFTETDTYGYTNFWGFIKVYFTYLICYEMFSLFINIIMWLPRWARNKVRDWNGSDSV